MIYKCSRCKWEENINKYYFKCPKCGAPIEIVYDKYISLDSLRSSTPGIFKYADALPRFNNIVSVGEGDTPIVYDDTDKIYYMLEHLNPSGSFKDRGASIVLSYIKSFLQNDLELVEDSSGNAAISYTLYSRVAGYKINIFMPRDAPHGKRMLVQTLGAYIHLSRDRDSAHEDALRFADGHKIYIGHVYNPFFIIGMETIAYHVHKVLNDVDHIFIPFGSGTLYLGFYRGLKALYDYGYITKFPRLYIVEASGYEKIGKLLNLDTSYEESKSKYLDGIKVSKLPRRDEVLKSIKELNVKDVVINDYEASIALRRLIKNGFIVEPTSAAGYAAYMKMFDEGSIKRGEKSIVILTGNGLKVLDTIHELLRIYRE